MKQFLKRALFSILGKDPEAVIVIAGEGPHDAVIRALEPARRFIHVPSGPDLWLRLRRAARGRRVALCAAPLHLARTASLAFPNKVLAFNPSGERHHLRLSDPISSLLFLIGTPLDRIRLRPTWLCPWTEDRSTLPRHWRAIPACGFRHGKPRVAICSPYCPWPLSHGGAVRIFHLLREAARDFDIVLFAFEDGQSGDDFHKVAELCAQLHIAAKPRYREPRWSSLLPPEACEFYTPELHAQLDSVLKQNAIETLQVEYTQLARYGGRILVEHDVTWDLFNQIHARAHTLSSWWDLYRWRRFESRATRRYPALVAMSDKDAGLLAHPAKTTVIANGVDLARFRPAPPPAAPRLLFIGSFRHFPNVRAWRFFTEEVWPLIRHRNTPVTAVAGPDPQLYWPNPSTDPLIDLRGFVADVQPLYDLASIVIIPTLVSAGTNLKALEAMASARPIVSTPSGVAGLGLMPNQSVLIAETPAQFAAAIERLLDDDALAARLAANARAHAESHYGWPALARLQTDLWNSLSAR